MITDKLIELVDTGREDGVFTAACSRVTFRGQIVLDYRAGRVDDTLFAEKITADTLFDVASLTKPVVTATSVLQLIEARKIRESTRVGDLFDTNNIKDQRLSQATVHELITHTAGLPAVPDILQGDEGDSRQALAGALQTLLIAAPGTVYRYSDCGYILLGAIIEAVSGQPLHEYVQMHIFKPLGMAHSTFLPGPEQIIVATSPGIPAGRVHDPRAAKMGGVAGHAGLFSTARDLGQFAESIRTGEGGILDITSLGLIRGDQLQANGDYQTYGWFRSHAPLFPGGGNFSSNAYAHSGFTGCLLGVDPTRQLTFVLLTNRVYCEPDDNSRYLTFRREWMRRLSACFPPVNAML